MPYPTRSDVLPIQAVVATASPSAWRDGLVLAQADAQVTVALLDGEVHDLVTGATPQPGEPVALHPVAGLLAVGGAWFAARPAVG
ncbi:nuclease [Cellulomonas triticagri]|uniref:Nuclease n=1 Tax=Cellulomonas triticagri TaxID=2483352 RepID=A0A3M2J4B4_9CELL|nr:nuclease [Cellulomonas triticagri]RMI06931.1 nuclease [Cellulomonas triticagri]